MPYRVSIRASRKHGTLYVGVTNDIARRVWQHRRGMGSRFVKKYRVSHLVLVEAHEDIARAIQREKTRKEWPGRRRSGRSNAATPGWEDLYELLNG